MINNFTGLSETFLDKTSKFSVQTLSVISEMDLTDLTNHAPKSFNKPSQMSKQISFMEGVGISISGYSYYKIDILSCVCLLF